ncbi:hypothetical protein PHLGIDRAFT_80985, partial [Phlebiopsis gigantea 11061_1 CR5-6]
WAKWLLLLEHVYNSPLHASTGISPYFLLHGFEPRSPLDILEVNTGLIRRSGETEQFERAMRIQ